MLFLKGRLVGAKLFLKASQRAVRTISLSTFSHGYHIRTSCQRADELDQSLGTRPAFHTPPDPIARPDRLVFESSGHSTFLDTNRGQVSSRQKSGSSGVGKLTKPRGSVFHVCARCAPERQSDCSGAPAARGPRVMFRAEFGTRGADCRIECAGRYIGLRDGLVGYCIVGISQRSRFVLGICGLS